MSKPSVFISYSHNDEAWKDRVVRQLKVLQVPLSPWHDRHIQAGAKWEDEIRTAMDRAEIAVLLISADFLASEFILGVEVPRLLERHREEGMQLYPIIISPCAWKSIDWLRPIQCRPKDGEPLETFFETSESTGNKHLAMMAQEIATLLGLDEQAERPSNHKQDVLEVLAELVKGQSNVAKAPDHLENAIKKGLSDVAHVLTDVGSQKSRIDLDDVDRVISTAISHGAGIYNHSHFGRIGCARIYHRAATGLLELMPAASAAPGSQVPRGVQLATEWLDRIVQASPLVKDPTADDLAWELRFSFDSMHFIPLCDNVQDALSELSWPEPSRHSMCEIIRQVLERCQAVRPAHVGPYLLRHTARVIASLIEEHKPPDRALRQIQGQLDKIVSDHPRIVRRNLADLAETLHEALVEACRATAAADTNVHGRRKNRLHPRNWFSKN